MSVTFFSCLMTVATCSDNSKAVKHHVTLAQLGKVHMRVKLELFLPLFYYTFSVSLFCFLLIHTLLHSKKSLLMTWLFHQILDSKVGHLRYFIRAAMQWMRYCGESKPNIWNIHKKCTHEHESLGYLCVKSFSYHSLFIWGIHLFFSASLRGYCCFWIYFCRPSVKGAITTNPTTPY